MWLALLCSQCAPPQSVGHSHRFSMHAPCPQSACDEHRGLLSVRTSRCKSDGTSSHDSRAHECIAHWALHGADHDTFLHLLQHLSTCHRPSCTASKNAVSHSGVGVPTRDHAATRLTNRMTIIYRPSLCGSCTVEGCSRCWMPAEMEIGVRVREPRVGKTWWAESAARVP